MMLLPKESEKQKNYFQLHALEWIVINLGAVFPAVD